MPVKLVRIVACAIAVATTSSCGAGGRHAVDDTAAGVVPATVRAFVVLDTSSRGHDLAAAVSTLERFPAARGTLARVDRAIDVRGPRAQALRRTVGPQVDVAILDEAGTAVAFTKPDDEKKLERVLDSSRPRALHAKVGGWIAFTDDRAALDAVKHARVKLTDRPAYRRASPRLSHDALVRVFVPGAAAPAAVARIGLPLAAVPAPRATRWVAAAVLAHDGGLELQVHTRGRSSPAAARGERHEALPPDALPSGVVAAISSGDLGATLRRLRPMSPRRATRLEASTGLRLDDLAPLLAARGALYVRAGNPVPAGAILLELGDRRAAATRLLRLASFVTSETGARGTSVTAGDVAATAFPLGAVTLYCAARGGTVLVTNDASAVADLGPNRGRRLTADAGFARAADAAPLPDRATTWSYVDVERALPLADAFARLAGTRVPDATVANARPLRATLVSTTRDGLDQTTDLFLATD